MSSNFKANCCGLANGCCKLHFSPVGRRSPQSLGNTASGYERAGLYCTEAETSCSWVNLIDISLEAWWW